MISPPVARFRQNILNVAETDGSVRICVMFTTPVLGGGTITLEPTTIDEAESKGNLAM